MLELCTPLSCIDQSYWDVCYNGFQQEIGRTPRSSTLSPEPVNELATKIAITATYSAELCEMKKQSSETVATIISESASLYSNPDPRTALDKTVNQGEQLYVISSYNVGFVIWYLVMDQDSGCFWISDVNIELSEDE